MSATGRGFQLEYPSITLHAISRGEQGPSIYCQLDDTVNAAENAKPQNDEEDVADMSELTILPKDPSARASATFSPRSCTDNILTVEPIFEALSLCASLHPDPGADDEMDDDDDAFVDPGEFETFNGTADEELSEVGRVRSDLLNNSRFAPY